MQPTAKRPRPLVRAVGTLVMALLVLAPVEGALRFWQWLKSDERTFVNDPYLHHRFRSGMDVTTVEMDGQIKYRIVTNSLGWPMTREVPRAKRPGVLRVAYLGDSNVVGKVDPGQRISDLMEAGLREQLKGAAEVEVLNVAAASYSPYIFLVQARQLVRDFDPDVMVMNVDMNDVVNDYVYERFAVRDAAGRLQAIAPVNETSQLDYVMTPTGTIAVPKQGAVLRWLAENTAIGYYVDKVITRWRFSGNLKALNYVAPDETANWLANEWNPAIEATVARSLAAIGDWAAEARAAGVAVALSANPHLPQFEGEWSARPLDALKSYAASKAIPYIDLYAAMSARYPGKEARALFWPPDPTHYNARGYEVFADAHLAFFASPRGRALLRPRQN